MSTQWTGTQLSGDLSGVLAIRPKTVAHVIHWPGTWQALTRYCVRHGHTNSMYLHYRDTDPVGPWSQSVQDHRCQASSAVARRRSGWIAGSRDTCCPASLVCTPSPCTVGNTCRGAYDRRGQLSAGHWPCWWQSPVTTPREYEGYTPEHAAASMHGSNHLHINNSSTNVLQPFHDIVAICVLYVLTFRKTITVHPSFFSRMTDLGSLKYMH